MSVSLAAIPISAIALAYVELDAVTDYNKQWSAFERASIVSEENADGPLILTRWNGGKMARKITSGRTYSYI